MVNEISLEIDGQGRSFAIFPSTPLGQVEQQICEAGRFAIQTALARVEDPRLKAQHRELSEYRDIDARIQARRFNISTERFRTLYTLGAGIYMQNSTRRFT